MSFNPERMKSDLARGTAGQRSSNAYREVAAILKTLPDASAFLRELLQTARRCFFAHHAAILNYHAPTDRWFFMAQHGVEDPRLRDDVCAISRTVVRQTKERLGATLIVDAQNHELTRNSKSIKSHNIKAALCTPIFDTNGDLWGVIYLANAEVPDAFGEAHQQELERFAEFCGVAIQFCEHMTRLSLGAASTGPSGDPESPLLETESAAMREVLDDLGKAAAHDVPILLLGEPGVGKDVLARWIHDQSRRKSGPFQRINCAAIPSDLLEAELFGIESNTATGVKFREGRIRIAEGGTVFLDEIGDMPLSQQARLLQVIQTKQLDRVGGDVPLPADVRFVLATNRNLLDAVAAGEFRRDLYHRISMFTVHVPALRERPEDIPRLVEHLLARITQRLGRSRVRVPKTVMARLSAMPWEGNIRELESFLTRSVILQPGDTLSVDGREGADSSGGPAVSIRRRRGETLQDLLNRVEGQLIRKALRDAGGMLLEAAGKLDIPESTLRSKMKRLKIKSPFPLRM